MCNSKLCEAKKVSNYNIVTKPTLGYIYTLYKTLCGTPVYGPHKHIFNERVITVPPSAYHFSYKSVTLWLRPEVFSGTQLSECFPPLDKLDFVTHKGLGSPIIAAFATAVLMRTEDNNNQTPTKSATTNQNIDPKGSFGSTTASASAVTETSTKRTMVPNLVQNVLIITSSTEIVAWMKSEVFLIGENTLCRKIFDFFPSFSEGHRTRTIWDPTLVERYSYPPTIICRRCSCWSAECTDTWHKVGA